MEKVDFGEFKECSDQEVRKDNSMERFSLSFTKLTSSLVNLSDLVDKIKIGKTIESKDGGSKEGKFVSIADIVQEFPEKINVASQLIDEIAEKIESMIIL